MNVLILTPDRVGSTLLQRLLTVYMLRKGFDKPVINLHELTNGLVQYYNTTINQTVLGKPEGQDWGYHQSLSEVIELLSSTDHYKTSRLAHYHIVNRQDSIAEQLKFYDYLNKNFYIISCRRENLLEHALSWSINAHSKKLNVYSPHEKINSFYDIYRNGIEVQRDTMYAHLKKYKEYIDWSDRYFNIQSHFYYENDVPKIEDYILNLDFMQGHANNSWQDMFGQSFVDYNTCHKLIPDLLLSNNVTADTTKISRPQWAWNSESLNELNWNTVKGKDWPEYDDVTVESFNKLPAPIQSELTEFGYNPNKYSVSVTADVYNFLNQHVAQYKDTDDQLNKLVQDGFLVTGIPIKLQSFSEKKSIVRNFNECVDWYNEWTVDNSYGKKYSAEDISQLCIIEDTRLTLPLVTVSKLLS
jgi:hypothetical protein